MKLGLHYMRYDAKMQGALVCQDDFNPGARQGAVDEYKELRQKKL